MDQRVTWLAAVLIGCVVWSTAAPASAQCGVTIPREIIFCDDETIDLMGMELCADIFVVEGSDCIIINGTLNGSVDVGDGGSVEIDTVVVMGDVEAPVADTVRIDESDVNNLVVGEFNAAWFTSVRAAGSGLFGGGNIEARDGVPGCVLVMDDANANGNVLIQDNQCPTIDATDLQANGNIILRRNTSTTIDVDIADAGGDISFRFNSADQILLNAMESGGTTRVVDTTINALVPGPEISITQSTPEVQNLGVNRNTLPGGGQIVINNIDALGSFNCAGNSVNPVTTAGTNVGVKNGQCAGI